MGAAWSASLQMMRLHGLKTIAIFAAFYAILAAIIAIAGLGASDGLMGQDSFLSMIQTGSFSGILLFLFVPIIAFLAFVAQFASWRLMLSGEKTGIASSLLYGAIASSPAILCAVILLIGAILLISLVFLPFGFFAYGIGNDMAGGAVVAILLLLFGCLLLLLFFLVRLGLAGPIMASARRYNPFSAMAQSWRITRGNSWRLMLYAFLVNLLLGIVVSIVSGIILALMTMASPESSVILSIVMRGASNLFYSVVVTFVVAGVFQILGGGQIWAPEDIESVFG